MYHTDAVHPDQGLERKLQALYTLNRDKKVDLTFRPPYLDLLKRLGNPHLHLPPVIHVAGTNGKGSVIAFMRAILEAAGYKVHVYTSPHLVKFNERIVLAGQMIGDAALEALLDETVDLNDGGSLTFFEITTALAFAAFARTPADILLLETGLGGRLDCTNVIENPLATVIMPIGYDHMEFLGDTLEQIAGEKAGIMKPGTPCIVAPQPHKSVRRTLIDAGTAKGSPVHLHGSDWFIEPGVSRDHEMHQDGQVTRFPTPSLAGNHQIFNAGTAIRVLNVAKGFHIPERAIRQGVTGAVWPGRLQRLFKFNGKIVPENIELWLDGGHNESAAEILEAEVKNWLFADKKPVHLVLATLNKRDPQSIVKPLLPLISSITATEIKGEILTHTCQAIEESLIISGFPRNAFYKEPDPVAAVQSVIDRCVQPSRILATGSLYLIGKIIAIK